MRFSLAGRAVTAAAGATTLLMTVAGCTPDREAPPCPTTAQAGLAVAVGARANSPEPAIPRVAADYLTNISEGQGFTVIRVDGAPSIACGRKFHGEAVNESAKKQEKHDFGKSAVRQMRDARSQQPEADPLGALTMAATSAGPGGIVVLADSGLQTKAPLDFRAEGILYLSPDRIVDQLRSSNLLPDTTGRTVVLSGIGYTADPQKQPHPGLQRRLVAIWTAIAKAGGSTDVQVLDQANTSDAVTDKPKVSRVSLPEPDQVSAACGSVIELPDRGAVGFQPDQAVYREPARAKATLLTVADFLEANPTANVTATGTVAHYGDNVKESGLALDRARTVAGTLQELGISPARVASHGDGWGPNNGEGDDVDQSNRRVVLQIVC